MSTPQQAKAQSNGTTVNTLTELKPPLVGQTNLGRFFEMLSVLFFAASVVLLVVGYENPLYWLLALYLLVNAFLFFKLAVRNAVNEVAKQNEQQAKLRYKVNGRRLTTLESVGVPADVRSALRGLINESPMTAEELLAKATLNPDGGLSLERMKQWRETILTYTRIDGMPAIAPSANGSHSQGTATAATN